jgi:hypothetical protein
MSLPDNIIREVLTVKIQDGEFMSKDELIELSNENRISEERSNMMMRVMTLMLVRVMKSKMRPI